MSKKVKKELKAILRRLDKQMPAPRENPLIVSGRMYDRLIDAGMLKPKKYKKGKWRDAKIWKNGLKNGTK